MTWIRVTASTLLVGLVAAVVFVWPAQANTPACDRQQNLEAILQGGHYVPDPVLQMAEAHCWGGSVAEEKVRLDSPGLDIIKSCQKASRQPRDEHEARCIASWLTYWDKPDAEPDACVHYLLAASCTKPIPERWRSWTPNASGPAGSNSMDRPWEWAPRWCSW
jgi:hypothetical protein